MEKYFKHLPINNREHGHAPSCSRFLAGALLVAMGITSMTAIAAINLPSEEEAVPFPPSVTLLESSIISPTLPIPAVSSDPGESATEARLNRINWARAHFAVDPEGLVDACLTASRGGTRSDVVNRILNIVTPSPVPLSVVDKKVPPGQINYQLADLLIGIALQESLGDKDAIGSHGEEGAFQVIAADWGTVPTDLTGQAIQCRKIITGLITSSRGHHKEALAHYNGGDSPPRKSFFYADSVLAKVYRAFGKAKTT